MPEEVIGTLVALLKSILPEIEDESGNKDGRQTSNTRWGQKTMYLRGILESTDYGKRIDVADGPWCVQDVSVKL